MVVDAPLKNPVESLGSCRVKRLFMVLRCFQWIILED